MIDVTGEANLARFVKDFIRRKGTVIITEIREEPLQMLKRSGLYDIIGSKHFFNDTTDAINYALEITDVNKCPYCQKRRDGNCRVFKQMDNGNNNNAMIEENKPE